MRKISLAVLALALSGCASLMGKDALSFGPSEEVAASERMTLESHTKSRLLALERSLNDFIQAKGEIPTSLAALVPDFLAEIPETALGIKGHKDSSNVIYYQADVIAGGVIDGSKLDDRGGWGYAYNDDRVIVFVNCTHKSVNGKLWYDVRGVY